MTRGAAGVAGRTRFVIERAGRSVLNTAMKYILALALLGLALPLRAEPGSVVERLIASYDAVQSVQVEIRRDTGGPAGGGRRLSRVYFRRPDRLHVESVTPPRRRIVADGATFYSYIEGDPKGFSRPVAQLEGDWLTSLRQVPGTAMDHLLRLRGFPEEALPAAEGLPTRVAVKRDDRVAVLGLDAQGRLARFELFTDPGLAAAVARYDYENFVEPLPGVWFATLQRAGLRQGREEAVETTRLSNLQVNQPIPDPMFRHETFFEGVVFTDNLDDLYGDP